MRTALGLIVLLAACGGSSAPPATGVAFAGTWGAAVGTGFVDMTLNVTGTAIAGNGVAHLPTGGTLAFAVSGTTEPVPGIPLSFQYADGTSEGWSGYAQTDVNHLTLYGFTRELDFTRQ